MKTILKIALGLTLVTGLAVGAEALTLKANMKQTATLLKQVTSTVTDSSKNQENIANVDKMIEYFTAAKALNPGVGSLQEYQNLMDQELALFNDLKTAFTNNDSAAAQAAIQKINVLKKEGHDKFN